MGQNGNPKKIEIKYVKTGGFRIYHIDGFFGGLTPQGKIYFEPYIDKFHTPKSSTYPIEKDGSLGVELRDFRSSEKGGLREIEAGLILDINIAQSLVVWLQGKIDEYNQLVKKTK
ncbi:MAG TPA: hypothetical protein VGA21_07955 [Cyclobacteriaceae bacterium]|jgi:hypothetical protein